MISEKDVINSINSEIILTVSSFDIEQYPLPLPYIPEDRSKIRAIILGMDPSNFSKEGSTKKIKYVFDVKEGDKRFFSIINQNLKSIGLSLDNVVVENIVRNYMDQVTYSNTKWGLFAEKWLPYIKQELDNLDPERKLPVLVTAEKGIRFLAYDNAGMGSISEYYKGIKHIPIGGELNKLGRNLIPFSRHIEYKLDKCVWSNYKNAIIKIINNP